MIVIDFWGGFEGSSYAMTFVSYIFTGETAYGPEV